jgi:CheY-like chemotaxis protein
MFKKSEYVFENVLIVDDTEIDILFTVSIIQRSSIVKNIIIKQSVLAGLDYLQNCNYNREPVPELIFLDMNMPHLDGFDFLNAFQQLDTHIKQASKVVMLSASTDMLEIEKALNNPSISHFIRKPLSMDALIRLTQLNYYLFFIAYLHFLF